MRRAVLIATAALLAVEALAFALVGLVLGLAVRKQQMSVGGLSPDAMAIGAWAGQGALAVFLLVCAVVAARAGWLGPGPRHAGGQRGAGRIARGLLIGCAVLHGLLGAVLLGLSGWLVFTGLMLVLAVLVLALLLLREPGGEAATAAPPAGSPPPVAGGPQPA
ncbi:hypothetical protein [Peterkaempfera griseoplana]|uniref:hypothetical protein n=1 Tax=Peterkaempfera griseoplana TaxID=66896 RepID=UPI0006E3BF0B|nr:hypothetical protein [Peterkaempfera griseoplana]